MNSKTLTEYSFESHFFYLESSIPLKIHYVKEGKGPVLLCLHGNPTWSFMFRHVINHLSKSHTVIAIDHIGCGLSSKPKHYTYNLKTHITNLEHFILNLNVKKFSLLVHDWGGAIGLGFAVKYPHFIDKVIISNTAAFRSKDIPISIALCKIPYLGEWLIRRINFFAKAALHIAAQKPLTSAAKNGLLFPYNNYDTRIAIARFVQDIPLYASHPSYLTLKEIELGLNKIGGKKMLLWGMKDFCFHRGFLELWRNIYPEAQVAKLEEAGHYLFEDEPQKTVNLIEKFLE